MFGGRPRFARRRGELDDELVRDVAGLRAEEARGEPRRRE